MSRRHKAEKREINPDPKFGDLVITKFMNAIMYHGKKSVAESIVYGALDVVEQKTRQEPVAIFHQALDNIAPHVEVRSRRVGWCDLPGSGRRPSGTSSGAGHPLADQLCAQP
jgi:small subunit ribosomal protein S7